ncbi:MAG TPA: hypothetical protein PKD27_07545 [Tepidiformaceae bacterium]|nr:hypothetical protein [Tepidiformaceae bacterium]
MTKPALSIGQVLLDARLGDLRYVLSEDREQYDPFGAVAELFRTLDERNIRYVLVGGIAMLQYVEGRNTRDIDLIISPKALALMPGLELTSQDADFARAMFQGVQVDLLLTTNKVFELVRAKYTESRPFAEREVVCATVQGMVILKLFALPSLYRQGEFARAAVYEADLVALSRRTEADFGSAIETLRPHMLASDIAELTRLASELPRRGEGYTTA